MITEPSINKFHLRNGERYTFYLNNGHIIRGTFDHYVFWDQVPNNGIQISNYFTSLGNQDPFVNQTGLLNLGLDDINIVSYYNIGPESDVNTIINSYYGGIKYKKNSKKYYKKNYKKNSKKNYKKNYKKNSKKNYK